MSSERFFTSFHQQAMRLNEILPKPLFAKVVFVNPVDGKVLVMIFKRKFLFPKVVARVRGTRIFLDDRGFYEQLKKVAMKLEMSIVL